MTDLKKKIIALSRNSKIIKIPELSFFIALTLNIIICSFIRHRILALIVSVLSLFVIFSYYALIAIRKCSRQTIEDNSLIYIALSDKDTVEASIKFIMLFPVLLLVSGFIQLNFFTGLLYIIISVTIIFKVPALINSYFLKELL